MSCPSDEADVDELRAAMAPRLEALQRRIEAACAAAGRAPDDVTLVAVSKRHPPAAIRAAHALGLRDFGENYVQELAGKATALADLPGLRWHAIGPLQRNKMQQVVGRTALVHTLSAKPAHIRRMGSLAVQAGVQQRVLLQVQIGDEDSKAGCRPADAPSAAAQIAATEGLVFGGLMTIPPPAESAAQARAWFDALATCRDAVSAALGRAPASLALSMGMSADFEVAIAAGADLIRVGTAIFGPRPR